MPPEVLMRETQILERVDVAPLETSTVEKHALLGHLAISRVFKIEERCENKIRLSLLPTENGAGKVQAVGQMGVQLAIDDNGVVTATHISRRPGEYWRDLRVETDLTAKDIEGVLIGIFDMANWSAMLSSHLQY